MRSDQHASGVANVTHDINGRNLKVTAPTSRYEGTYECSRLARVGYRTEYYEFHVFNCTAKSRILPDGIVPVTGGVQRPLLNIWVLLSCGYPLLY